MTVSLAARFHFLLRPTLPALTFALRTTAAALAALAAALALGLHNPHWAAMTVWIVAQPTRGQVVSKGLYRLAGTAVGSVAAAGIIAGFGHAPLPLSLALAAWVGACAAASTLLPGFRSYGAVLAGYSAALVAVIGLGQHDDIAQVAMTRVASVALGIVVSGAATVLFLPGSGARELLIRARVLSRDTLRWASLALSEGAGSETIAQQHRLLAEIAQVNSQADLAAAGSRDLGQRMAQARALIAALLTLMAHIRARTARPQPDDSELARALARTANAAARPRPEEFARWPEIGDCLAQALERYAALGQPSPEPAADSLSHPDWRATLGAGLRAFGGVAAVGLLWTVTGWVDGPPMLMATAIMCSVFAASDTPSHNVLMAMKGASLAVLATLVIAVLLPAHAAPLPAILAVMSPFMVLGGLAMANRATIIPGTDFSMLFLLLSQPGVTPHPQVAQLANMGLGIICGMATAALVNRIGVPASPAARAEALSAEIVRDLAALAAAAKGKGHKWRNKAYHRVLRLVLKANEAGGDAASRLEGALAALNVGMAISRLRVLLSAPGPSKEQRAGIQAVLAACRRLDRDPDAVAARALAEATRQDHGEAVRALHELADALSAQPAFFRR
ncbi:MAG: FUSC family protein [Magnetospirillum sp.]|nr:FUSC family protein [Magnetospirillum sp.]